ncbi:LysE family translocator [Actibacterium sp. 188UL27-1]|uniref:LysE family translocator n=1 Tax=Actibacterium sp. 188UL27-1 TaxID=2786961 RepID=UPI00195907A4|nr:LysE family translocator [Actibacterium sp. 188UL27-1]MBM7069389.1 LysE family translocator [Actibacterium sp. 188UL27-1]
MDPVLFLAFLTTTLLFLVVPGPSVAFATAQALKYGTRAALVATAGDALGTVVHIVIAVSSLAALMAMSDMVLPYLQVAGGIFILYMAYQTVFGAEGTVGQPAKASGRATFWAGFFACVANPKAIVFFVALFPAFISPDHNVLLQSVVYGAIFIVLDAVSILGYALLTMHAVRRTTRRWLKPDLLSGMGLFGVGLAMVIKGYRAIPQT